MTKDDNTFTLTGTGYNIMARKADRFGKFKIDIELTDPEEIEKAEKLNRKYDLPIKDELKFMSDGKLQSKNTTFVTISAKEVKDGQFPVTEIPMKDSNGNPVTNFISHGAKVTATFKMYQYKGGTDKTGFAYPGGFGFQLVSIDLHEYTPFGTKAA